MMPTNRLVSEATRLDCAGVVNEQLLAGRRQQEGRLIAGGKITAETTK